MSTRKPPQPPSPRQPQSHPQHSHHRLQEAAGEIPKDACPTCEKPTRHCVCREITPVSTAVRVLILQHPQEKRELLGTARLLHRALSSSFFVSGLSWPNLASALQRADATAPPSAAGTWGVLYLGSKDSSPRGSKDILAVMSRRGKPVPNPAEVLTTLEGIVVLDGTWSQAKALWWRNAWLLKLRRLVLTPPTRSRYGSLRQEARPDAVSTLEAVAYTLGVLDAESGAERSLLELFERFLSTFKKAPR